MNHTKNYGLPQWELDDLIKMEDFNNMNASIEDGLTSVAAEASTAKTTAKAAMAQANMLPYAIGHYTGNGNELFVATGFRPRFLIITTQGETNQDDPIKNIVVAGEENFKYMVSYSGGGFTVKQLKFEYSQPAIYPRLNTAGKLYSYIAFR